MHVHNSDTICRFTYYAGNSSTFNAVATMAHCAIDGYSSDIAALSVGGRATGKKTRFGSHSEVSFVRFGGPCAFPIEPELQSAREPRTGMQTTILD